jgi:hypothetical protein
MREVREERKERQLEELNRERERLLLPLVHLRDGLRRAGNTGEMLLRLNDFLEEIQLNETLNAMAAADSVLVPIQCEYYALEGVSSLMSTIGRVKKTINPHLEIEGILLTMLDGRTNLGLQVVDQVKKHFKKDVFATSIPRNVRLGEAPSHGEPITVYDPRSSGAIAYQALAKEVAARNRKR